MIERHREKESENDDRAGKAYALAGTLTLRHVSAQSAVVEQQKALSLERGWKFAEVERQANIQPAANGKHATR